MQGYADVIQGMYHDTGCIGFRAIAQKILAQSVGWRSGVHKINTVFWEKYFDKNIMLGNLVIVLTVSMGFASVGTPA